MAPAGHSVLLDLLRDNTSSLQENLSHSANRTWSIALVCFLFVCLFVCVCVWGGGGVY